MFFNRARIWSWWLLSSLLAAAVLAGCGNAQTRTSAPDRAAAAVLPVTQCRDLAKIDMTAIGGSGSRVTAAVESQQGGVAVCAVDVTLAPTIGLKVMLPTTTWSRRYLQVGCGGLCGRVSLQAGAAEGCVPLAAGGFVIASTDMGHQGMGGEFGRDPQMRADFAHRAVHLTAVTAKRLIQAFYGQPQAYAYFTGCSDGGREALVEAQRYPDDFDGIIAGAPALNFQVQNSLYHSWQARSNTGVDGKPILKAARLPLLHETVLTQCDGLDGRVDGLVSDPRSCRFDPAVLLCGAAAPGRVGTCFSAVEVEAVRRLYDGPRDPATGERLTVGGPLPGSELAWAGVFVPMDAGGPNFSERIALDALRNLSFEGAENSNFQLADLRFDRTTFDRLRARHALFDATNPDLAAFHRRGGKLILWHGLADPHISPVNTIAYHEAVGNTMGAPVREAFERLYLLAGVHHCSGGEGPSAVDLLTPMLAWVENGVSPQAIAARPASERQMRGGFGQPVPGRPAMGPSPARPPAALLALQIAPYPAINTDAGSHAPAGLPEIPAWAGTDFFQPYTPRER